LSKQFYESDSVDPCLFQDVCQGRPLDGTMSRDRQLENFIAGMFLQPDMASPLSHDCPSISLQCLDNPVVRQAGQFAQSSISWTCASSSNTQSSSTGSRYSSMASRMLARA